MASPLMRYALVLAVAATAAALLVSPLTPFTHTETAAELTHVLAVAQTINERAAHGWVLKERIPTSGSSLLTLLFTRQVPWYSPPLTPVATVAPVAPVPTADPEDQALRRDLGILVERLRVFAESPTDTVMKVRALNYLGQVKARANLATSKLAFALREFVPEVETASGDRS